MVRALRSYQKVCPPVRYYHDEHLSAYRKITALGYDQWNDLFEEPGAWTYENFQNRAFLDQIIPQLELPSPPDTKVLEYGCGTGPAACYLAGRGFRVDAFDLVPEAIAIARRHAAAKGLEVNFEEADVCELPDEPASSGYHIVLDSFCLQSIVTDRDRSRLFSTVRSRLKPDGYYLISTAMYGQHRKTDEPGFRFDATTGINYREVSSEAVSTDTVEIDGRWYIPHRRHLMPDALRNELESAGFNVLGMMVDGSANVVCGVKDSLSM